MNDLIWFMLVSVLFYFVPGLIKRWYESRKQPRVAGPAPPPFYGPPAVKERPEKFQPEPAKFSPVPGNGETDAYGMDQNEQPIPETRFQPPATFKEVSPWGEKLDQASIVNGVIFAEILRPPRALRKRIR